MTSGYHGADRRAIAASRALHPGAGAAHQLAPVPVEQRPVEGLRLNLPPRAHVVVVKQARRHRGLVVGQARAEAIVQAPRQRHPMGAIVRAVLPRIVQQGIATREGMDAEALDERLLEGRRAVNATHVGDMVSGAWAFEPA